MPVLDSRRKDIYAIYMAFLSEAKNAKTGK
jgi:hypothetical protein